MSSVHRAATIGGLTAISASAALLSRYLITHRKAVTRSLNPSTRIGLLRLVLLLFSLLNVKNLPFVWHIRFLVRALLYHFRIDPKSVPPASLFEPLVTSTRAPLLECDTNLHKSNSTYFSDLDQSRAHLYACLMRKAFTREWKDDFMKLKAQPQLGPGAGAGPGSKAYAEVVKDGEGGESSKGTGSDVDMSTANGAPTPEPNSSFNTINNNNNNNDPKACSAPKGPYNMLLGSISCHYHREIPPYTRYELWSRILAWDDKWFYSVTHIVKPGVAAPKRWTMQPWRTGPGTSTSANASPGTQANRSPVDETTKKKKLKDSVYATSIAKVVVKRGRLTIPPEIVLQRSGLLPPRPETESEAKPEIMPEAKLKVDPKPEMANGSADADTNTNANTNANANANANTNPDPNTSWTWHKMEAHRQQGLRLAAKFAELDAAQALFDGGKDGALGEYADLFWA